MAEKLAQLAEQEILDRVGNVVVLLGYFEHQVDLQAKIIKGISEAVQASGVELPVEVTTLLAENDKLLEVSSIDFKNITSQLESYKLPKAVQTKSQIRDIQGIYLQAKLREGKF